MILEFDSDGRVILPDSIKKDNEKEKKAIILEKCQVNVKNPAIANLKIKIGPNLEIDREGLIKRLYSFCERFAKDNSNDVNSSVELVGETLIIEAKSSMKMYSFLQDLVADIREVYGIRAEYGETYEIVVKGSWASGF